MSTRSVSIHPYFKLHPGKLDTARALLAKFIAETSSEEGVLQYEFTMSGDTVFCRESYVDADAALHHLHNVDGTLKEMLTISDLERLELHGPADELEKLHEPLEGLNVAWFAWECGLDPSSR